MDDYGDCVPRVPDWRLAEVLAFGRSNRIRELIDAHLETLEKLGTLPCRAVKSMGGRPGADYLLNFNQAIFRRLLKGLRSRVLYRCLSLGIDRPKLALRPQSINPPAAQRNSVRYWPLGHG